MKVMLSYVLNRSVRQMAQEQFFLMATRCCMGHRPLLFFITLLFTVLGVSGYMPCFVQDYHLSYSAFIKCMKVHHHCGRQKTVKCLQDPNFQIVQYQSTAKERAKHAGDYFTLLRHLLNYAYNSNINLPNAEVLLNNEIDWLKRIRVKQLVYYLLVIS